MWNDDHVGIDGNEYHAVYGVVYNLTQEAEAFQNELMVLDGDTRKQFIETHSPRHHQLSRFIELNTIIGDLMRVFGDMTALIQLDEFYRQGSYVTAKHMMVPSNGEFNFCFVLSDGDQRITIVEKNWDVGVRIAKLLYQMDHATLDNMLSLFTHLQPPIWQT
jgi:hypothetical protein